MQWCGGCAVVLLRAAAHRRGFTVFSAKAGIALNLEYARTVLVTIHDGCWVVGDGVCKRLQCDVVLALSLMSVLVVGSECYTGLICGRVQVVGTMVSRRTCRRHCVGDAHTRAGML